LQDEKEKQKKDYEDQIKKLKKSVKSPIGSKTDLDDIKKQLEEKEREVNDLKEDL